jgi:hypothetical protein
LDKREVEATAGNELAQLVRCKRSLGCTTRKVLGLRSVEADKTNRLALVLMVSQSRTLIAPDAMGSAVAVRGYYK